MALPTGCATCMTFRHRHFSLSRLIETAEIEPGKAETGEKKAVCEEHACAISEYCHNACPWWFAPTTDHVHSVPLEKDHPFGNPFLLCW